MVRTQIQLTEAQFEALRARAAAEGRSMADLIRASVDEALRGAPAPSREERRRRALRAIGRFRSAPADLSRRHDRYLAEAYR
jgi:plasmid stability protein